MLKFTDKTTFGSNDHEGSSNQHVSLRGHEEKDLVINQEVKTSSSLLIHAPDSTEMCRLE